jgi:predicted metal-dependent hydrolase
MKRTLSYQEATIEYLLKQKKQKHLYLKYRYPNLIVSAPKGMSLATIEAFLISN